ncbi:MAG: hypothetical protein IJY28_02390 [Clostridia bacterium]|nr:hypothetical protein [Clostridia bacterium]
MLSKIHPEKSRTQVFVAQVFTVLWIGMIVLSAMPFSFGTAELIWFLLALTASVCVLLYFLPMHRGARFRKLFLAAGFGLMTMLALHESIQSVRSTMAGGGLLSAVATFFSLLLIVANFGATVGALQAPNLRTLKWSVFLGATVLAGQVLVGLIWYSGFYSATEVTTAGLMMLAEWVARLLCCMGVFVYALET